MKTTEKKFSELAVGDTFFYPSYEKVFAKVDATHAEARHRLLLPTSVAQSLVIDAPDKFTVAALTKREIFDGHGSVKVDFCCDGSVVRVDTIEAPAFRYAVTEPILAEAVLVCKQCRRTLHTIKERQNGTEQKGGS